MILKMMPKRERWPVDWRYLIEIHDLKDMITRHYEDEEAMLEEMFKIEILKMNLITSRSVCSFVSD